MQLRAITHRQALLLMLVTTLMWSIGGVTTRFLEQAKSFEITFWRSLVAALTVLVLLAATQGRVAFVRMRHAGPTLWLSGICWAVMFSCFMIAMSLTTVANVLITQSLGPVFTALLGVVWLRRRLPLASWIAIGVAAAGIALMYAYDVAGMSAGHILGVTVAMGIPIFSAINWTLLQRGGRDLDFSAAVLIGGLISCLVMLPLAWPFTANAHDLALLTLLGVVQLGVPCVLAVRAARGLASHETSLLALLEVIFGIVWTVLFAGERPGITTLIGGAMVLAALAWQSLNSARERNAMSPGAVA